MSDKIRTTSAKSTSAKAKPKSKAKSAPKPAAKAGGKPADKVQPEAPILQAAGPQEASPKPATEDTGFHTFYQADEAGMQNGPVSFRLVPEEITIGTQSVEAPKKLGDGNFGMVFEAVSTVKNSERYALKVLYKHRAGNPQGSRKEQGEYDRAVKELRLGVDLPARLAQMKNDPKSVDKNFPTVGADQLARLAAPLAYSKAFDDFEGREALLTGDVEFSHLAYLMPKFDESLKDQVERPTQDGGSSYGRLLGTTKLERAKSTIPIAMQLARGLQVLHAAGMRHQDIKPANIYCKKDTANNIDYRLGDLGFLQPHDPAKTGTAAASIDSIGIGTKHYRSIEQVDFCDTAECHVRVDQSGDTATLITRDPKFLDTIIRKGDLAFFARSSSHRLLSVQEVTRDPDNKTTTIKVSKNGGQRIGVDGGGPEPEVYIETDKTQVSFFKNPSAKTDLFGLGAIVFDIVTIGSSPERFYELLRRFDKGDQDIKRLMDQYATWIAGTLEDPDLGAVFGRVNGDGSRSDPLHYRVLTFILKCMMSDANGSFYREGGDFERAEHEPNDPLHAIKAWKNVLDELEQMKGELGAENYDQYDVNVLTRRKEGEIFPKGGEQTPDPNTLSNVLSSYLTGEPPNQSGTAPSQGEPDPSVPAPSMPARRTYRWIMGGLLLKTMADEVAKFANHTDAMTSLSIEHVQVKSNGIAFSRKVYEPEEGNQIPERLRSRDPILTRVRPFSSQYEPIWWRFGARRVDVDFEEAVQTEPRPAQDSDGKDDASSAAPEPEITVEAKLAAGHFKARYSYKDFAFGTRSVQPGDYILAAEGSADVYEITRVFPNHQLEIKRVTEPSNARDTRHSDESSKLENSFLIQRPEAADYYGGMLAVYFFHFLISKGVGQDLPISDFPTSVYEKIADYPVKFSRLPGSRKSGWQGLEEHTIQLIIWLSLGGFCTDANGTEQSPSQRLLGMHEAIRRWFEHLEKLTTPGGTYDTWNLLYTSHHNMPLAGGTLQTDVIESTSQDTWNAVASAYIRASGTGDDHPRLSLRDRLARLTS